MTLQLESPRTRTVTSAAKSRVATVPREAQQQAKAYAVTAPFAVSASCVTLVFRFPKLGVTVGRVTARGWGRGSFLKRESSSALAAAPQGTWRAAGALCARVHSSLRVTTSTA